MGYPELLTMKRAAERKANKNFEFDSDGDDDDKHKQNVQKLQKKLIQQS